MKLCYGQDAACNSLVLYGARNMSLSDTLWAGELYIPRITKTSGNFVSRPTKYVQIFRRIDHSRRILRRKMGRKRVKSRKKDTYERLSRRCVLRCGAR